ncbi:MAG TPA: hypothetical protein VFR97_15310 [Capillimicrobium sp.]|nr:hypothetical protein [Capillimicrobium sp.]
MRRALGLWLLLFAVYAATVGLDAGDGERWSARETHMLLSAESIVGDRDLDLRDEYETAAWTAFDGRRVSPTGGLVGGRLLEPQGIGFPVLIAPAYALGGTTLVQLWLAALVAAGFVLAAAIGRRVVPDPWATRAALVGGVSPPVVAAATRISPEAVGGTVLAAAVLAAFHVRERPSRRAALGSASAIALLPWLAVSLVPVAAGCAAALARWLRRRRRAFAAFVAIEVVLFSAVMYVSLVDRLYGGLTPYASSLADGGGIGASSLGAVLDRWPRLVGWWLDRDDGVLRWAPFAALGFVSLWLLWRSRRDRLAVAVGDQVHVEVAAAFLAGLCALQLAVATFLAPAMHGDWAPARLLLPVAPVGAALAGWGLRHAPRAGAALAAITVAGTAWLLAGLRLGDGGLQPPSGPVPWGGAQDLLPRFGGPIGTYEAIVLAAAGVALVALAVRERRAWHAARAGIPVQAP